MTQKKLTLAVVTGNEGIAPEILPVAVDGLRLAMAKHGYALEIEELAVGALARLQGLDPLPQQVIDRCREIGLVLKAPLRTEKGKGYRSLNVALRKELDLFANLRPIAALPGVRCLYPDANFYVVRENTEGLYSGDEEVFGDGDDRYVISRRIVTRKACLRIARYAFELAEAFPRADGTSQVSLFHKANILKEGDGLFLECFREVAEEFDGRVEMWDEMVDAGTARMILKPLEYHVIVTENMNGDVLSDGAAALVGGLGIPGSVNIGVNGIMAEAIHGTADQGPGRIDGKGIANPTALIRASALLFRYLPPAFYDRISREDAIAIADDIDNALHTMYDQRLSLTGDVGGTAGTQAFHDQFLALLN